MQNSTLKQRADTVLALSFGLLLFKLLDFSSLVTASVLTLASWRLKLSKRQNFILTSISIESSQNGL